METKDLLITGYTTRDHLLLDLDDTTLGKATHVIQLIMNRWPEVGDCLILISSSKPQRIELRYSWNNSPYMKREGDHFHLVFDGRIGWNKCCHICETLAGLKILEKDYEKIRTFRGDMTLRVSGATLLSGHKAAPYCLVGIRNKRFSGPGVDLSPFLRLLGN